MPLCWKHPKVLSKQYWRTIQREKNEIRNQIKLPQSCTLVVVWRTQCIWSRRACYSAKPKACERNVGHTGPWIQVCTSELLTGGEYGLVARDGSR
jgi:hypothetical protein